MPLTVPEKNEPQPHGNEYYANKWITVGKSERNLVSANVGATIAVAHALLAINDTLKKIAQEYTWSKA